ncbi:MAG: FHA domain-containing protein [Anaerolineae bacterium]|nr:FHA domain-containing protein [Anaerolineae bacterium]
MEQKRALVIMFMSGPDDGQKIYLSYDAGDGYLNTDGSWQIVFGRREECDVSIPFDTQVSRQHAMLRMMLNGEFLLIDSGSLNGTFVRKERIDQPTRIKRGELFRLGRTSLRIQPEMDEG